MVTHRDVLSLTPAIYVVRIGSQTQHGALLLVQAVVERRRFVRGLHRSPEGSCTDGERMSYDSEMASVARNSRWGTVGETSPDMLCYVSNMSIGDWTKVAAIMAEGWSISKRGGPLQVFRIWEGLLPDMASARRRSLRREQSCRSIEHYDCNHDTTKILRASRASDYQRNKNRSQKRVTSSRKSW